MAASATLCFPGDGDAPRPQGSESHCELRQHHCATAQAGSQSDSGTLRRQDLCAIGGAKGISRQLSAARSRFGGRHTADSRDADLYLELRRAVWLAR